LKLYRHEASRGLFATAELLVTVALTTLRSGKMWIQSHFGCQVS